MRGFHPLTPACFSLLGSKKSREKKEPFFLHCPPAVALFPQSEGGTGKTVRTLQGYSAGKTGASPTLFFRRAVFDFLS
jgi:hypothetical protein